MTRRCRLSRRTIQQLLALALMALMIAATVLALALTGSLRYWTGEEELLPQVRGLFHLLADCTRPRPNPKPFVPVCHASVNPYGVNTFLEQEVEPEKRERTIRMIAEAGFHWIRQEFPWEDIEVHGKGDFEDRRQSPYRSTWEKYDNIVDLCERYGIEIIARLSNPPEWSRAGGNTVGTLAPPDDYNDFGDFVETVVRRYRGRIKYYQIWNEPNIYPEWGERPVNPEEYVALLRVAYERAKQADPEVIILSGALAATIENDLYPHGMNDFIFLQRMYDAGAAPYFDIMSIQGYGLWSGPYDRRMRPRVLNFSRPLYIRDIMVKNGDSHKPIWISEMNWNAIPIDHPAYPAYGRYTLSQQAEYVIDAYKRCQLEWPWIGVVNLWYFKRATDTERDQPMYYFRMVEPDFTPMPVYDAVKELTHSTPVLGLGLHQEDHWALSYLGNWDIEKKPSAQCGSIMSSTNGALVTRWRGTNLSILCAGPALLTVHVDQERTRTYHVPAGFSQLQLAWHLPDAEHDVSVKVLSGKVEVDAIQVGRDPEWLWQLVGASACLISVGAVLLRFRHRVVCPACASLSSPATF